MHRFSWILCAQVFVIAQHSCTVLSCSISALLQSIVMLNLSTFAQYCHAQSQHSCTVLSCSIIFHFYCGFSCCCLTELSRKLMVCSFVLCLVIIIYFNAMVVSVLGGEFIGGLSAHIPKANIRIYCMFQP
jgi:hypothetical protein